MTPARRLMTLPEFWQIVEAAKREIKEITVSDLKHMQQSGEKFALVDVREREEHAKGMIPGAVAIPRGVVERDIEQATTNKQQPLVIYCAGGARSALAALNLKQMGFENVMSLAGGYTAWDKEK
ncbi:Rhodanese/sulfurtransferase-like protein [Candidatus Koribacter versatilis Ellin345]|uniref:Rhodanese/sulfurtransferase-like protein n=2 Tax=Candidatus Korobacter versatilis TaxID=658062 RepID=Q1IL11_KORVE|nr:Rhodanese/sulfurtransferase-like protein [Candidatus Koribacter versatilis Ellin345]